MKLIFTFLFASIFTFCQANDNSELAQTYINNFRDIAIQEMERTGIPASIKLAQGLLESDWGRSDLAKTANNHFGIKCGGKWKGGTFYKEDDDRNKKGDLIESCFRAFSSPTESYMAHSDFLKDPKKEYRYGFLFEYSSTDYKSWAKGLKKSGYATDPSYPSKLIKIIEMYDLHVFDKPMRQSIANHKPNRNGDFEKPSGEYTYVVSKAKKAKIATSKSEKSRTKRGKSRSEKRTIKKYTSRLEYSIESINETRMVIGKGGESIAQLARKVGVSPDEILKINEIYTTKNDIIEAGANIFIEKKKRRFKGKDVYHTVAEGETMESIAQLYGIRLKSLFAKNRMPSGSKTVVGQKLHLSKTSSVKERPKFTLEGSKRKHKFLFEEDESIK